jgi:2-polyprenyl-3-methyl-5-hydroxy-6-metoxy-1,4-benzoquinol methylase
MNTTHRSKETEIMDDFNMGGETLTSSLDNIAWINRILGGNKPILKAIKTMAAAAAKGSVIHITDVGCGNGDMLRAIADMGKQEGFNFKLTGIDANQYTIDYGTQLSKDYTEISYSCNDVLSKDFSMPSSDIILFTLTLHHFKDEEILILLRDANKCAKKSVIVNDLERSKISYILFGWLSYVFRLGEMNANDGKVSILRGFKRKELEQYAGELNLKQYSIQWKWAFRYQWIIQKL